jgi:hypothetical protein
MLKLPTASAREGILRAVPSGFPGKSARAAREDNFLVLDICPTKTYIYSMKGKRNEI